MSIQNLTIQFGDFPATDAVNSISNISLTVTDAGGNSVLSQENITESNNVIAWPESLPAGDYNWTVTNYDQNGIEVRGEKFTGTFTNSPAAPATVILRVATGVVAA